MKRRIGVGTFETSERMRQLVNEVLDSNRISYGPKSKQFESEFAAIHQSKYGVLSNSGTSSLQVALQAMKEIHNWPSDVEVIVPSVTFVATLNVVLHNGLTPVVVDVDPITYNMDYKKLRAAINHKTRCVIPVHLFGQPANMTKILSVIDKYNMNNYQGNRVIKVIADSCESMFATHKGNRVGSMSDIGCFSTYVAHLIATGVGGIGITNNPEYAAKMRSLVNHGRDGIYIDMDAKSNVEVISRRFKFESIGHSFRITELEAALGLAQLEDWEAMIAKRRYNAARLTAGLDRIDGIRVQLPRVEEGNQSAWMMYPIVLLEDDRLTFASYLESIGIETREMLPLTNQLVYRGLLNQSDFPVAAHINEYGVYVGIHQGLTESDIDYMIDAILAHFE